MLAFDKNGNIIDVNPIQGMYPRSDFTPQYSQYQTKKPSALEQGTNLVGGLASDYVINQGKDFIKNSIFPSATEKVAEEATKEIGKEAAKEAAKETAGFGSFADIAGAAAALHGGYNTYKNFGKGNTTGGALSGVETGAGIGTMIAPGVGTAIGAGIGGLAGAALGSIKTGKSADQQARDKIRANLQKIGFFGDAQNKNDWTLENPDNSSFDIGKDGGAKYNGRRYFELDMNNQNPIQGTAIGQMNPLAYLITGGDKKLGSQFAGYLTNTIMQGEGSNNQAITNVNALDKYKKAGYDNPNKAHQGIDDLLNAGKIDSDMAAAFHNGINTVFGTGPKPQATSSGGNQSVNNNRRRNSNRRTSYQVQDYQPNVYSPTTTAPISTSPYGDNFAQSLANIYLANQG